MQDVIRMPYDVALCHPDEITKIWSLSHPDDLAIPSISSGWLIVDALCHPDDLPGVGNSSGWVTANSLCHPDDILFHFMSSGWLNGGWFLIRMSYGNVIMSSGWDTLPFVSHPDEIANFDFPQHAVALQRFRSTMLSLRRVSAGQWRTEKTSLKPSSMDGFLINHKKLLQLLSSVTNYRSVECNMQVFYIVFFLLISTWLYSCSKFLIKNRQFSI